MKTNSKAALKLIAGMSPESYIAMHWRTSMPEWLANYRIEDHFSIKDFLAERTVFYPGGWFDIEPMKVLGLSHSVHSFVYADYNRRLSEEGFLPLFKEFRLEGYTVFDMRFFSVDATKAEVKWRPRPHMTPAELAAAIKDGEDNPRSEPCSFLIVLERENALPDEFGPARLAIWYVVGDGIVTYDCVYANGNAVAPFAMVVQDHESGGNYTTFGNDGFLHSIAVRSGVYPRFILQGTEEICVRWKEYDEVPGVLCTSDRKWRLLEHTRDAAFENA